MVARNAMFNEFHVIFYPPEIHNEDHVRAFRPTHRFVLFLCLASDILPCAPLHACMR
jgi:hypothetical protein